MSKANVPLISVVVATYNSSRTLEVTLDSIRNQNYPQDKVEILIIDGGSKDSTLEIARRYKTKVIQNTKTDLIFAKHIGFTKALGKYLIYLDSDESFENNNSLELKLEAMYSSADVKAVIPSGYKSPRGTSFLNDYINEFGDPFSFFMYRDSKLNEAFLIGLKGKFNTLIENNSYAVFNLSNSRKLPLIELWAGGCMIDLDYMRKTFKQIKSNPDLIAQTFYLITKENKSFAVTKNDATIHNSTASFASYSKKIISRIKNNVYANEMGKAGFLGRFIYQDTWIKAKKYLFIPYSLLIIFALIDAIYLSIKRQNPMYLLHLPLCVFTALGILYYSFLKLLKIHPKLGNYGN